MARIAVAVSGGVDSSVTLAKLHREGHDVFGVTMRHLDDETFGVWKGSCCSRAAIAAAGRLCAALGVPHHVFDFEEPFARAVLEPTARFYASGRTPNPCTWCNEHLKFGVLLEKARALGAETLATGHYARSADGTLLRARDSARDQSYFLYRVPRETLRHVLFPLGDLTKDEVRRRAAEWNLEMRERADSMDICFAPEGDFTTILSRFAPGSLEPGEIVDEEGRVVGRHDGIGRVTIGQRRGLGLRDHPDRFVVAIEAEARRLRVGPRREDSSCRLENVVMREERSGTFRARARLRSQHAGVEAEVMIAPDGTARVLFAEPQINVTPGQACVLCEGEVVLGGGEIARAS